MRFLALAILIVAQSAFGQAAFEVASVRLSSPDTKPSNSFLQLNGDNIRIGPTSLTSLIAYAYRVRQVEGPSWLTSDSESRLFEINAKFSVGKGGADTRELLQSLLAERFALRVEIVTKEVDGFALKVGKDGQKLSSKRSGQEARTKDAKGRSLRPLGAAKVSGGGVDPAHVEASTISGIIDYISGWYGNILAVDETGLTGEYDIQLDVPSVDSGIRQLIKQGIRPNDDDIREQTARDLSDALGQVGLKLERRKVPVKIVVIKNVEKKPTEN